MDTAHPIETPARTGIARRIRAALVTWLPAAPQPLTREELMLRHEQLREAERLLENARTGIHLIRVF